MRTDTTSKRLGGVLSGLSGEPEWAVEYAEKVRFIWKIVRGEKLPASKIKHWIKVTEDFEELFLKAEPFLRYRPGVMRNPVNGGQCMGAGWTLKLTRETRTLLKGFLKNGRPLDIGVAHAVYGLSKLYLEKKGAPEYWHVGFIITEVFSLKKIAAGDFAEWARKTADRYAKLLENDEALTRATQGDWRNQIQRRNHR